MWLLSMLSDFLKMNLFYYINYHLQIWHVYTACVSQHSELVTSAVGAHRDDEQEIVTGSQSFMNLFFLLLWQLYWFRFTRVLWNYIYLNWKKALFCYFKILKKIPVWNHGNRQYCFSLNYELGCRHDNWIRLTCTNSI
jgi:hypothetical protein